MSELEETPQSARTPDLPGLLKRLNHWRPSLRRQAMAEARALPVEERMALLEMEIDRFSKLRRRSDKIYKGFFLLWVIVAPTLFILEKKIPSAFLNALLSGLFSFILWQLWLMFQSRFNPGMRCLLREVDDFCFLGTYLKLLGKDCDWETRQELVIPVKRLLTQLRTDQANLFTPEQRAGLASLIGISFRDVPLTLAVLKALEQIGDAQAIPAVQNLADQPKLLPHELDHLERQHLFFEQAEAAFQEVQEAARHCLPFLTENEARFQQSDTLLRPSSEKGLAQEELLRPAALGQETPPQLLLRASEQESHS